MNKNKTNDHNVDDNMINNESNNEEDKTANITKQNNKVYISGIEIINAEYDGVLNMIEDNVYNDMPIMEVICGKEKEKKEEEKLKKDDIVIEEENSEEDDKKNNKDEENEEPVVKVKENPMIMGAHVEGEPTKLIDINEEAKNIIFEVYIFGMETIERQGKKGAFYINNLKVSDKTDSYLMKIVKFDKDENDNIMGRLKVGSWIRVFGSVKMDDYLHSFIIEPRSIEKIASKDVTISDNAEVKRVELHAHTMMSQMDGVTKVDLAKHTNELVTNAINMGYRGVAITDHNGCQGFPIAYQLIKAHNKNIEDPTKHFKGLYGTELTLVDDVVHIVKDPIDAPLKTSTFVVFDTETTGFNASSGDVMIEIGAVKIEDGVITDRFDEFINPGFHIPDNITALTEISDDMVSSADTEENVTKRFLEWTGDLPMVAHNAKFDISFIEMAMKKYNLGKFTNAVIDTLELSRSLDRGFARHSLSALVKRYNVPFDEESHHRADYDAEGTALVFNKMISKLENIELVKKIETDDEGINIYIGEENEFDPNVTVIKTSYNIAGEEGTIAIIGPKRMEYDKVVTLLNYLKSYLER